MAQHGRLAAWERGGVPWIAGATTLWVLWLIWGSFLPNSAGNLGVDYGFWLPELLAGTFWHLSAPALSMPWFNPSQCAGIPWHADPQGAYLSLPQFAAFLVPPLRAIQISFLIYAASGFAGTYWLAARCFHLTRQASVLAACLFTLNGFFAARMMVGHLSFAPFMLVPALGCCLLDQAAHGRRACLLFGTLFALALQAGMAVLVLPATFTLAIMMVIQGLATGASLRAPALRLIVGSLLGLALCAGKLAAVFALMAHIPRDAYPLPGVPNLVQAAWMAFRSLFLWPTADMTKELVNSALILEPHEFDDRVGPVPLLFMAAGWLAWRRQPRAPASPRGRLLWDALAVLLFIPLALNTYAPYWTALLKHIPVLRSASSMLRWFAAYMLPAVIGGALALDRLFVRSSTRWLATAAGVAATVVCLLSGDRAIYGASGLGVYDPAPVEASWRQVNKTGRVPPITRLAVPMAPSGQPDMSIARGNLLTQGASPLFCYDPVFGYRLEAFHQGTLHAGPIFDVTRNGDRRELNLKNPACYVFPGANACAPGDTFLSAQSAAASDFAAYRPFAFAKPWWAHMADWLGALSFAGVVVASIASIDGRRR